MKSNMTPSNGFNWGGFYALLSKEIRRFMRVATQTVVTPMVTTLLYLLVFVQVLEGRYSPAPAYSYAEFLVPGLVMMAVIQNAFANSSSSLLQAKMNGSITFMLIAPLSALEILLAFVLASVLRAILVGVGVALVAALATGAHLLHPLWALAFVLLTGSALGLLGLLAAIMAEKFDHMSAFQNFVIMPLTFLSGVFWSLQKLPENWQTISALNPLLYMIDGFRYGMIGVSDFDPARSAGFASVFVTLLFALTWFLLQRGWRLRG